MPKDPTGNDDKSPAPHGPRSFATTHWSLIVRAGSDRTIDSRDALEELCRKYWPPLYHFARGRGISLPDAEDATQGFFTSLLEHGAIARADASRGRFRTFLLSSFVNFLADQQVRAHRLKRGGGHVFVSLEALQEAERQGSEEPATNETPESIFERRWALRLMEQVFGVLRQEYSAAGQQARYEELRRVVWGGRDETSHAQIAQRLGVTEGAVRVAVFRLRKRFREELRREVAQTVANEAEVEEELRHLLAVLSA